MPQPLPVSGYTAQTDEKVAMVNRNKLVEELAMRQVDAHVRNHDSREIDQRMVALARTHLQTAFMYLNRAVFQPQRLYAADLTELEKMLEPRA